MNENYYVCDSLKPVNENLLFQDLAQTIPANVLAPIFKKYEIGTGKKGWSIFWNLSPALELINGTHENVAIFAKQSLGLFGGHLLHNVDRNEHILGITNQPEAVIVLSAYINRIGRSNRPVIWTAAKTLDALTQLE